MSDHPDLRTAAHQLFHAAVAAADPHKAMIRAMEDAPLPDAPGRTFLIAVGKAAPAMMQAALEHVSGPHEALVVTHHENHADCPGATIMHAGHPVPDAGGEAAGQAVMALLSMAGPHDRVVALISGGGSALLPAPVPGVSLADKAAVNRLLLESGLDIVKMNLVRQQLSQLKGGGMLRLAAPAPVTAYILSDVIGDDLRAIASGPTVSPIGTASEALALLEQVGVADRLPQSVRAHLEAGHTPPPAPEARNIIIGSNGKSLAAMAEAAAQLWSPEIVSDHLTGDVEDAANEVLATLKRPDGPKVWLFGGETTVRLKGTGLGGRNQELALRVARMAPAVDFDWCFLSGGTDGRDGPTDAAGAIVDAGTVARIAAAGQDVDALLANNDSYAALKAAGDLLVTEATGTNVADVQALIAVPSKG
ncbi:glycerate kinase type-2 family protein [Pseudoprimorskyibacter insulae]|uniref:D-glycerate 2-kinase n=1 Tax=Pseudoprimorskyibacter insulae TaxID=1695997 RepID=A0A2R8AQG9_9RHOB|nr:DUF4147 domain-containing protein [Pseudoprimorskyibacter insulae]SPF78348.1 D-glycerate 2-kinase [Pseudoprimorskyibacter insulae]